MKGNEKIKNGKKSLKIWVQRVVKKNRFFWVPKWILRKKERKRFFL